MHIITFKVSVFSKLLVKPLPQYFLDRKTSRALQYVTLNYPLPLVILYLAKKASVIL